MFVYLPIKADWNSTGFNEEIKSAQKVESANTYNQGDYNNEESFNLFKHN